MISFLDFELLHVSSSRLIYKLHSHIKELRQPLSPHQILRLLIPFCLNFDYRVATSDILHQERIQPIELVLHGPTSIQLEINYPDTRSIDHTFPLLLLDARLLLH